MEDNPLKAKKRAQTTPETELSTEMQMMEDKFIVYDFTKVKRSHSLSRGRIRPVTNDSRMNSGTLDGVVTRTGGSRTDNVPMTTSVKTYRPDSPSDRIGQDRFNSEEDQTPLTEHTYRSSPLNSPALENNYRGNGQNMVRQKSDSEKAGYFENQQKQQQQQHPHQSSHFNTQRLELQSEAIILPPTSLPRPLQPRDNVTGMRVGSPNYSPSTHPSSPTNSLGNSTVATATPLTAFNSSPPPPSTPLSGQHNKPGAALFTTPDSGTSLSSLAKDPSNNNNGYRSNNNISVPLMESANIPVRRAVRGREASGQSINSMPAAISSMSTSPNTASNPRLSSLHPAPSSSSSNPRRPLEMSPTGSLYPARPASAYTTTPGDERFMYQQQQQQQYTTGLSPRPQQQQQPNQQQLLQQQQQQLHQQQLYQYEQAFN